MSSSRLPVLAASWLLVLGALVVATARPAAAQTYTDADGFYADIGLALGWNNLAGGLLPVDNGTMTGFSFGGGYRFNRWVAAEVEFNWVGGGELVRPDGSLQRASMTSLGVAAVLYPMAFVPTWIPQWVQPNVSFGIGTGLAEQQPVGVGPAFGSVNQTVLLTRIGVGVDVMLTKHWGTIVEGNYYVTNNGALTGVGILKIGLLCRF